jgi:hypothetical protein
MLWSLHALSAIFFSEVCISLLFQNHYSERCHAGQYVVFILFDSERLSMHQDQLPYRYKAICLISVSAFIQTDLTSLFLDRYLIIYLTVLMFLGFECRAGYWSYYCNGETGRVNIFEALLLWGTKTTSWAKNELMHTDCLRNAWFLRYIYMPISMVLQATDLIGKLWTCEWRRVKLINYS